MTSTVTRERALFVTDFYTFTVTDYEVSETRRLTLVPLINGTNACLDGGSAGFRIKIRCVIPADMVQTISGYFSQKIKTEGFAVSVGGLDLSAYFLESFRLAEVQGNFAKVEVVLLNA